jgi:hypothetical protein
MLKGLVAGVAVLGLLFSPGAQALTFSNWITNYSLSDATAAGDPDGDGLPNLLEFALASGDPTVGTGPVTEMVFGTRAEDSVIPFRDVASIVRTNVPTPPREGVWYVGLRYAPREEIEGVRIRPQYAWWSTELQAWIDGVSCFLPPVADGTNGHVISWMSGTFRAAKPPKRAWLRLKVEEE